MKPLFAIVIVIISGHAFLRAEEPSQSPVVVMMKNESPYRPEVNGKAYSFADLKKFLMDAAERFGSKDPVIIRLDEDGDIHLALILVKMAHQTHDSVALEIRPPKSGGVIYIVEIPKNGIKTVIGENDARSGPSAIPDPNQNSQRDMQIKRLNNLQNGIIEE